MTLAEMLARFRVDADDAVAPYLWPDATVKAWLNDAVGEAAVRGRMLHESDDASVCQVAVTAGVSTYSLHPALYEIDHIGFFPSGSSARTHLTILSREELDAQDSEWRDKIGTPEFVLQDDTRIRLIPKPDAPGTLALEGYRLPLVSMVLDADSPEIHKAHHEKLIFWALHRAFSKPDAETVDPTRAALAEAEFTRYFGMRPDSDLRRATRRDVPHHNTAFWA